MKRVILFIFTIGASFSFFTSCNKEDLEDALSGISSANVIITPAEGDSISYTFKGVAGTTGADSTSISIIAMENLKKDSTMAYPALMINMKSLDGSNTYNVNLPVESLEDLINSIFDFASFQESATNGVILALSSSEYWIMTSGSITLATNQSSSKKGTFSGSCVYVDKNNIAASITGKAVPMSGEFNALSISF